MPIGAGELLAFRKREYSEASKREAKVGSQLVMHKTIGGVSVSIASDQGFSGPAKMKVEGIDRAIKAILAKGFAVPELHFVLTNAEGVENVAFMGNAAGERYYTIYLGPKISIKNPPHLTQGVSDAVYDGTQRFFGNPKQHAMIATIIIHEIGHVLHEFLDPDKFWTEHEAATMTSPAVWGLGAAKVSQYGQKNACEFVAETFAGVLSGKSYEQQVKIGYRALGGPEAGQFFG